MLTQKVDTVYHDSFSDNLRNTPLGQKVQDLITKVGAFFCQRSLPKDVQFMISRCVSFYDDGRTQIDHRNEEFVRSAIHANRSFFDSIETYPLDPQQCWAILHDEDNVLVVAGAGTGKTSTIVGKVAYLIKRCNVRPRDILLLAFNRNAAQEMQYRITKKLGTHGKGITVSTFHKLGLDIISDVTGVKPTVEFEQSQDLETFISKQFDKCLADSGYAQIVTEYFAYNLCPYRKQQSFSSLNEYRQYLKSNDIMSFKGEALKSLEEVMIANYLFLHGVNYKYEQDYEIPTATQQHRQYRPDFYLPDHRLYIEHFALDRTGHVPKWFTGRDGKTPTKTYTDSIEWKRTTHKAHGTVLVETFSYQAHEGTLLNHLEQELEKRGVVLKRKPVSAILKHLHTAGHVPRIVRLLVTFLTLLKSNHMTMQEVREKAKSTGDGRRNAAFVKLLSPIYDLYEEHLKYAGRIDFSDMLLQATQYLADGRYTSPFRHILIDEFQDMSIGRYKFVKQLLKQNSDQKLFCVGDDWQSIYRFTGSDIRIFTNFEEYFGFTKTVMLDTTFRFDDATIRYTTDFIQKNPRQLKKNLRAGGRDAQRATDDQPYTVRYMEHDANASPITTILDALQNDAIKENTRYRVFIIGRYNHNAPPNLKALNYAHTRLTIDFRTAHKSKGLEADFVIINDVIGGKYGFPSEIVDDPVLNMVLQEEDGYPNAEERRLFYVALTRAKRKTFIISRLSNRSCFVSELDSYLTGQL